MPLSLAKRDLYIWAHLHCKPINAKDSVGAAGVTEHCATRRMASAWEMGELGFPVARICCGWIYQLFFPSPQVPPVLEFTFKRNQSRLC